MKPVSVASATSTGTAPRPPSGAALKNPNVGWLFDDPTATAKDYYRRTGVFPQLKLARYDCLSCGYVVGPFRVDREPRTFTPGSCASCQRNGPFKLNQAQTIYKNYQRVTLQETPGTVPPGRVPRAEGDA